MLGRGGLRILVQLGVLWGFGFGAPARAAEAAPALTDSQLVATLHQVNQIEVQAGKLAQQNGSARRVRQYGRTLVRDHRRADRQLRLYARSSRMDVDVAPPAATEADLRAARTRLQNLQTLHGTVFDEDFAGVTMQAHTRAIQLVSSGRRQTTDRRLKAMLAQLALELRQHKQMAADLARPPAGRARRRLRLAGRAPDWSR